MKPSECTKTNSYNIIGDNADIYNFLSDVEEIKSIMKESFDFDVNSVFIAYISINEMENGTQGEINLVLSGEEIKADKIFKKNMT